MCWRTSGPTEQGYALVLVLVTMAVILLVSLQQSSRVVREIRVAAVRASAEQAFYVAESGFNKIRAEIIVTGAPEPKYLDPATPQTESLRNRDGDVLGTYTLHVTQTQVDGKTSYSVVSDAVLRSGAARRTVSGTIEVTGSRKVVTPPSPPSSAPINTWITDTAFDP